MRHPKLRMALFAIAGSIAAAACSGGGGGGGGGGGKTAVSGNVQGTSGGTGSPLAGATVGVAGGPSTTTDAGGNYTLMLQSNATVFIKATASGYIGDQAGLVVPPGGTTQDLTLISNGDEATLAGVLGITLDPQKGALVANFNAAGSAAGLGATLSAVHGSSFTLNNSGFPVLSDTVVGNQNPFLIFTNVQTGTTTVTPTGGTCTLDQAITNWNVDASTLTEVNISCQ